jgi:hypothetical protein
LAILLVLTGIIGLIFSSGDDEGAEARDGSSPEQGVLELEPEGTPDESKKSDDRGASEASKPNSEPSRGAESAPSAPSTSVSEDVASKLKHKSPPEKAAGSATKSSGAREAKPKRHEPGENPYKKQPGAEGEGKGSKYSPYEDFGI